MFLADDFMWCISAALHMLKLFDNIRKFSYDRILWEKNTKKYRFSTVLNLWTQTTDWPTNSWNWKLKIEKQTLVLLSVLRIKQWIEIVNILFVFEISIRSPLYEITTKWTHFKTHLSSLEYSPPFWSITIHVVINDRTSL